MDTDTWAVIANTFTLPTIGFITHWVTKGCASGAFQRNSMIGIRVRGTLSSDAGWKAGHQAALLWTQRTWQLTLVATLVTIMVAVTISADWAMGCYFVGLVAILAGLGASGITASRAGKAATAKSSPPTEEPQNG